MSIRRNRQTDRDPGAAPRRGRPPSAAARRAILDAARDLLVARPLRDVTMEAVAAGAGVSKATVYRHWATKELLALAVVRQFAEEEMSIPDLGDTRAELVELVADTIETLTTTLVGPVIHGLVSSLRHDPDLATEFRHELIDLRRAELGHVIDRGIARGDLRPDGPYDIAAELLVGPVFYRLLLAGEPLERTLAEQIVDAVLPAFVRPRS